MNSEFAILKQSPEPIDLPVAAAALAQYENVPVAEMLQLLHQRPGILMRGLSEEDALNAAAKLQKKSIAVLVLPESKIVDIPAAPSACLRTATLTEEHLIAASPRWRGEFSWSNVFLLDIVQQLDVETKLVFPESKTQFNKTDRPTHRSTIDIGVYLELICVNPLLRMRIDRETFRYNSTGLPMNTIRERNFQDLCQAIQTQSPNATLGPGYQQMLKGINTNHQSNYTIREFENLASWYLSVELPNSEAIN